MKLKLYLYAAALAALIVGVIACGDTTVVTGPTTVVVGGQPGASPSPGTSSCGTAVASVRVNPFGYTCDPGVERPANNSGLLPLGCTAAVTATPKDATGKDVPAAVHGPAIEWRVALGEDRIEVTDWPSEPFNKNIRALSPGEFSLTATVCGITGAWNGRVTAP